MLWRLAVAAFSLVGFLGGATILASQLERDVTSGFGGFDPDKFSLDPGAPPSDVKPFRFDGLTLPKDIPFEIPEGAIVNPDGSITLPDGSKLPIDGSTFKDVDITLPKDGTLKLPDDASFDGSKIACPSGCTLNIPDVGDYELPAGSDLELPADLAQQLSKAGYSGSNLPEGLRIPEGTDLSLPQLKVGDGDLISDGATKLIPPDGSSFGLPEGLLENSQMVTLPGGTEVDQTTALALLAGVGYLAATQAGYTPTELPPSLEEEAATTTAEPVQTFVEPEGAVQKGAPFFVRGYVKTLSGSGLPGVTVLVYMNASVSTPGTYIGSTTTGADGNFRASMSMPSSLPAGNYVFMANSQPIRVGETLYAGGWG